MKELFELFWIFFKIGAFTFGGGYAMIPQVTETVVEKKKWLKEDEMIDIIAIAESTPGPCSHYISRSIPLTSYTPIPFS